MAEQPNEALVILDPAAGPAGADEVRQAARVTQSLSSRVLVVDAAGADLDRVRRNPGVLHVVSGPDEPGDIPGLDEQEALFVAAWALRQKGKGERPGEGLAWDAPGFTAPDPPR
jgi:hypothetical protein